MKLVFFFLTYRWILCRGLLKAHNPIMKFKTTY